MPSLSLSTSPQRPSRRPRRLRRRRWPPRRRQRRPRPSRRRRSSDTNLTTTMTTTTTTTTAMNMTTTTTTTIRSRSRFRIRIRAPPPPANAAGIEGPSARRRGSTKTKTETMARPPARRRAQDAGRCPILAHPLRCCYVPSTKYRHGYLSPYHHHQEYRIYAPTRTIHLSIHLLPLSLPPSVSPSVPPFLTVCRTVGSSVGLRTHHMYPRIVYRLRVCALPLPKFQAPAPAQVSSPSLPRCLSRVSSRSRSPARAFPCSMSIIASCPAPSPAPYGPLDEGLLYAVLYSNIVLFSLPESGLSRLVSLARCVGGWVSGWVPLYTSSVPPYALWSLRRQAGSTQRSA